MNKLKKILKPKLKYITKNQKLIFANNFIDFKGKKPNKPSIIRERLSPRLYDYSYLMTKSFLKTMNQFTKLVNQKKTPVILDLGCGYKPFKLLFKNCQYIGVDISLDSFADIIADNHKLPFKDNCFDAVIVSEVLEHSKNEYKLIKELKRVTKNKGLVFISMPFLFPLHGVPDDFQRFTKYKLKGIFQKDTIVKIKETNNLFSSFFTLPNLLLRILFGSIKILYPIYLINNLLALAVENISKIYRHKKGFIGQYWDYALTSSPLGYSLIVKIKK